MKQFFPSFLCCLILLGIGTVAEAQTSDALGPFDTPGKSIAGGPSVSIDDLTAEALEHSPALAAQRAKISAYRERVSPSGALDDPMLELKGQGALMDKSNPAFMSATAEISQPLPFPGKRRLRREAASAEADAEIAALHKQESALVSDVRKTYAKIYAVDQEKKYLDTARELLKLITVATSVRYSTGESGQEAMLKAQLAVSRLFERMEDLSNERKALLAEFNRLLNRPSEAALPEIGNMPDVSQPKAFGEDPVTHSPDVAVMSAVFEAAKRRLDSAKKDTMPDFLAGIGAGSQLNVANGRQMPMLMLSFGITLPVWQGSKQKPLIRAAAQDSEMTMHLQQDAEAKVSASIVRLEAEWNRNERQILLYKEAILPQTAATLDAARAEYLVGRADFATVVQDFNEWLEARIGLARRESDRYSTWAEWQSLLPIQE